MLNGLGDSLGASSVWPLKAEKRFSPIVVLGGNRVAIALPVLVPVLRFGWH